MLQISASFVLLKSFTKVVFWDVYIDNDLLNNYTIHFHI